MHDRKHNIQLIATEHQFINLWITSLDVDLWYFSEYGRVGLKDNEKIVNDLNIVNFNLLVAYD
jgi:hypothetical protein